MALGAQYPLSFVLRAVDKTARGIRGADSRIGKLTKRTAKAGRAMTAGLTLPTIAAGVAVFRTAAKFEKGMNRVRSLSSTAGGSVLGLDQDMVGLEKTARKLGKSTVFSASEVTDAMGFYAQAGYDAQQITSATLPTLNLAAAAQIELGESANITAGILAGYSLKAEKAGMVSDVLTNAFTKAKTDLPALGEAMQDIGPIASSMNIGLAETVSAVQALSEKSIAGGEAGTKIRNMILAIQKPTPSAIRALSALKIEASSLVDEFGKVRSITGIVEALEEAGAQPRHLTSIFQKRDVAAVMALMSSGSEKMRRFEAGLLDVGVASKIADIQMRGAAGSSARFNAAMEGLSISIGKSGFLPWVTSGIDKVAGWSAALSDANPEMVKLAVVSLGVVAVAGPVILASAAIAAAIGVIGTTAAATIATVAGLAGIGALVATEWETLKWVKGFIGEDSWSGLLGRALTEGGPGVFAQGSKANREKRARVGDALKEGFNIGWKQHMAPVWTRAQQMNREPITVEFKDVPPNVDIHVPTGASGIEVGMVMPVF